MEFDGPIKSMAGKNAVETDGERERINQISN